MPIELPRIMPSTDNVIGMDLRFARRRPIADTSDHLPSSLPRYLYRTAGSCTQPDSTDYISNFLGIPLIAATSRFQAVTATYLRPTGVLVRDAGKMIELGLGNRQATFRLGIDTDLISLLFGRSGRIQIRLDFTPESFPNLVLLK